MVLSDVNTNGRTPHPYWDQYDSPGVSMSACSIDCYWSWRYMYLSYIACAVLALHISTEANVASLKQNDSAQTSVCYHRYLGHVSRAASLDVETHLVAFNFCWSAALFFFWVCLFVCVLLGHAQKWEPVKIKYKSKIDVSVEKDFTH